MAAGWTPASWGPGRHWCLVVAGGVIYRGHIQTGVAGRMVLVGRVAGTPEPPREIPLELALVTAVGGRLSQASRSARKARTRGARFPARSDGERRR